MTDAYRPRAIEAARKALGGTLGDDTRIEAILDAVEPIIWNAAMAEGQRQINEEIIAWGVEHIGEARRLDELMAERGAGARDVARELIEWVRGYPGARGREGRYTREEIEQAVRKATSGLDLGIDSPDPPGENG
jgi:hypothetical protein